MRTQYPGNFAYYENQTDWKTHLKEQLIDTDLLRAQVDFNRTEGGVEDFLNFRTEEQFIERFFKLTLPSNDNGDMTTRTTLSGSVKKLRKMPSLERSRESMVRLEEIYEEFVSISNNYIRQKEGLSHLFQHAASIKEALLGASNMAEKEENQLLDQAAEHYKTKERADAKHGAALQENAFAKVETAKRKYDSAQKHVDCLKKAEAEAEQRLRLLEAAALLGEINRLRSREKMIQEGIEKASEDLQPQRDELKRIGSDLAATLTHRVQLLRNEKQKTEVNVVTLVGRLEQLKSDYETDREKRDRELHAFHRLTGRISILEEERKSLVNAQVIGVDESAADASERHKGVAEQKQLEIERYRSEAAKSEENAKDEYERWAELKIEKDTVENALTTLQKRHAEGESERQTLAFNESILTLAGDSEIDPESDTVTGLLNHTKRAKKDELQKQNKNLEKLIADIESIDETGLASVDNEVRRVVHFLQGKGVPDVQTYAEYLSEIFKSPEEVRKFAEADPAVFSGVCVPNKNALDLAGKALENYQSNRAVTVAVGFDAAGNRPEERFVLSVKDQAAYDKNAARSLRHRLVQNRDNTNRLIDEHKTYIEVLDKILNELEEWRINFGYGRLAKINQEIYQKEEAIKDLDETIDACSRNIQSHLQDARDARETVDILAQGIGKCNCLAERANEYHESMESRMEQLKAQRAKHELNAQQYQRPIHDKKTEIENLAQNIKEQTERAKGFGIEATDFEQTISDIYYRGPSGAAAENLDALRDEYDQKLQILNGLETGSYGELQGRQKEINKQITEKEDEYSCKYSDFDRTTVEQESVKDNIKQSVDEVQTEYNKAHDEKTKGEVKANDLRLLYEKLSITDDEIPEHIVAFSEKELEDFVLRTDKTLTEQINISKSNKADAEKAQGTARDKGAYRKECDDYVKNISRLLPDHTVSDGLVELPALEDVDKLLDDLSGSNDTINNIERKLRDQYNKITKFVGSKQFTDLEEGEVIISASLKDADPTTAANDSARIYGHICQRLASIKHDISNLDHDLNTCVSTLSDLLKTAIYLLNRTQRVSVIPENVPRFGGQSALKIRANFNSVSQEQRREILKRYILDLVDINRIPETDQAIAAELVNKLIAATGRDRLGVKILKPKGQGDTEYMNIDNVTVSGGERLTAAMMIYLIIAQLRAEQFHGKKKVIGGILMLDNPMGKANKSLLLKTQIGLAEAMGIQLFFTTGIQDVSALGEFENIVRLRPSRQSSSSRRVFVEIEPIRTQVNQAG